MTRPSQRTVALTVIALVAISIIGWQSWRLAAARSAAAAVIPARPSLAGWPPELESRLAAAENRSTSLLRSASGLADLARLYHANGFYHEALACYDGLQAQDPANAEWPHLQAVILAGFGQLDDALPRWQEASRLTPDYLPARVKLGDALAKANRWDEAVASYRGALAVDAHHPHALLGLARCAVARNDWNGARQTLQAAIDRHPDFIGALSLMVTVQNHLGNVIEASRLQAVIGRREFTDIPDPWLDRILDSCYDPYRLSIAAAVAFFSGAKEQAFAWLERAIALAPDVGTYHRQLANLLFQTGDFNRAREEFTRAVTLNPRDSEAWALLVELQNHLGDQAGVDRSLEVGLSHCPQSAALHHAYGRRLSAAGRNDDAIREFQTAQRLRPSEANAYIGLAMVLFRVNRIDEAVRELRGALVAQPGHTLAMEILARHSIATADQAAARHWLRQLRDQARTKSADLDLIVGEYRQQFGQAPY